MPKTVTVSGGQTLEIKGSESQEDSDCLAGFKYTGVARNKTDKKPAWVYSTLTTPSGDVMAAELGEFNQEKAAVLYLGKEGSMSVPIICECNLKL